MREDKVIKDSVIEPKASEDSVNTSPDKRSAILFLHTYPRWESVLQEIVDDSDMLIISNRKLSTINLPRERFHFLGQVIPLAEIEREAAAEWEKRAPAILTHLHSGLTTLPKAESFAGESLSAVDDIYGTGMKLVFQYFMIIENVARILNLRAVVCGASCIERHQAAISAARTLGIPTFHIQHGSYVDPDYLRPERADYLLLSNDIAQKIIEDSRVTNTKCINSALPFEWLTSDVQVQSSQHFRAEARKKLGLPEDAEVIALSMTWHDTVYSSYVYEMHTVVEALETVIKAAMLRQESGGKVFVAVRQHPSRIRQEEPEAILSIAAELGFENLIIENGDAEVLYAASDVVVTSKVQTSVVLDALASARPVITLQLAPRCPHPLADGEINQYAEVAKSLTDLTEKLTLVLDNYDEALKRGRAGHDYIKRSKQSKSSYTKNTVAKTILTILNEPLNEPVRT